jgi:damage-control phosphatase, subfamily III
LVIPVLQDHLPTFVTMHDYFPRQSGDGDAAAAIQVNGAAPPSGKPTGSKASRVTLNLTHLPNKREVKAQWPRSPSRVRLYLLSATAVTNRESFVVQVDPNNPPWPAYRGYHEYSFAYETMGKRLPTILGKAIQDTIQTLNEQSGEDRVVDLVECIDRMDELMVDLSGNAKLRPIIDDGEGDIPLWNKEIAKYFQGRLYRKSA